MDILPEDGVVAIPHSSNENDAVSPLIQRVYQSTVRQALPHLQSHTSSISTTIFQIPKQKKINSVTEKITLLYFNYIFQTILIESF